MFVYWVDSEPPYLEAWPIPEEEIPDRYRVLEDRWDLHVPFQRTIVRWVAVDG